MRLGDGQRMVEFFAVVIRQLDGPGSFVLARRRASSRHGFRAGDRVSRPSNISSLLAAARGGGVWFSARHRPAAAPLAPEADAFTRLPRVPNLRWSPPAGPRLPTRREHSASSVSLSRKVTAKVQVSTHSPSRCISRSRSHRSPRCPRPAPTAERAGLTHGSRRRPSPERRPARPPAITMRQEHRHRCGPAPRASVACLVVMRSDSFPGAVEACGRGRPYADPADRRIEPERRRSARTRSCVTGSLAGRAPACPARRSPCRGGRSPGRRR